MSKYCLCGKEATKVNKGEAFCLACFEEENKFVIRMSNKPQPKNSKLKKFKTQNAK
jgi:hypothetical protein